MPAPDTITSRHNPLVARFKTAAEGGSADELLLDGPHLIVEALRAGLHIREFVVERGAIGRPHIEPLLAELSAAGIRPTLAAAKVIEAISPVRSPSGVVARADRPAIDPGRLYHGPRPLVLIAADIQDPGNVGAIARVAEAAGASGIVAAGTCADPFGWKALRGSMGSALRLPIAILRDVDGAIEEARRHGCAIVATIPRGGTSLTDADLSGPVAILVGGEGSGLPAAVIAAADRAITVPMEPAVESLNAAMTAAIVLYEARRQRRAGMDGTGNR
jgi:TrmH family RNA methyltransferase